MMDISFTELVGRLGRDVVDFPQERAGRRRFAPELAYGRHAGPPRGDVRRAAVLLALCRTDVAWSLPLTLRCATLTRHGGQVSLPGGLLEATETPREAAARELSEELGQRPPLQWIGELAPLFVYASNSLVTPCLAAIDGWPDWIADPREVDCVLNLPLEDLIDEQPETSMEVVRGPVRFTAPQLPVENHFAWGATAVLLGELQARLRRILNKPSLEGRG